MSPREIENAFWALHLEQWPRLEVSWHVEYMLRYPGGLHDCFVFSGFQRRAHSRPGNGRVALQEVCALQDRLGIPLSLACYVPKLFPYYESFGFVRGKPGAFQPDVFPFTRQPYW